jgi:hypothetical protein
MIAPSVPLVADQAEEEAATNAATSSRRESFSSACEATRTAASPHSLRSRVRVPATDVAATVAAVAIARILQLLPLLQQVPAAFPPCRLVIVEGPFVTVQVRPEDALDARCAPEGGIAGHRGRRRRRRHHVMESVPFSVVAVVVAILDDHVVAGAPAHRRHCCATIRICNSAPTATHAANVHCIQLH